LVITRIGGYWDISHSLFRSTPSSLPVKFIAGGIFASDFFDPLEPIASEIPEIGSLIHLTPLRRQASGIEFANIFHLFTKAQQDDLAQRIAAFIQPEQGSIIFGGNVGASTPGIYVGDRWFHSPESPKALQTQVLGKDRAGYLAWWRLSTLNELPIFSSRASLGT
jgi:hypothetical protein